MAHNEDERVHFKLSDFQEAATHAMAMMTQLGTISNERPEYLVPDALKYIPSEEVIERSIEKNVEAARTNLPSYRADPESHRQILKAIASGAQIETEEAIESKKRHYSLHCLRQTENNDKKRAGEYGDTTTLKPKLPPLPADKAPTPIDPNELVVVVSTFFRDTRRQGLREQSFRLLGSQTLLDFRKCIRCSEDRILSIPAKDEPYNFARFDQKSTKRQSAMFLIGDTLFDDVRAGNERLSTPIVKHYEEAFQTDLQELQRKLERDKVMQGDENVEEIKFNVRTMQETRLVDLEDVEVGATYLYRHQGDCDHRFTIDEIRCVTAEDAPYVESYPVHFHQAHQMRKKSHICKQRAARWILYNDMELPTTPCFVCKDCDIALHTTAAGEYQSTPGATRLLCDNIYGGS